MIMAYWNGMTWGVSSKQIAFLESLTTSYSMQSDTNADKEGQSPTEEVGKSLIEIAFNTTYRVETGTKDIRKMISSWKNKVGQTSPIIIGGAVFGPDKMQLQSVSVSNVTLTAKGVMRAASLAFKFKEYAEEPAGSKTKTNDSDTALNVGASASDKAQKKTVTIK